MQASHYMLVLAIMAGAATGCGQKGALYREAPAQEKTGPTQQDSVRKEESDEES